MTNTLNQNTTINKKPLPYSFIISTAFLSLSATVFLFWVIYFGGNWMSGDKTNSQHLPLVNALLNSGSAISLMFGYVAIKRGQKNTHRLLMISAFLFSALFLISYIYYHSIKGDTPFQGQGFIRPIYFFILISHIILSVTVVPLSLTAFFTAYTQRFSLHKKINKWFLPVWLYVSVTGVFIYLFLHQWFAK